MVLVQYWWDNEGRKVRSETNEDDEEVEYGYNWREYYPEKEGGVGWGHVTIFVGKTKTVSLKHFKKIIYGEQPYHLDGKWEYIWGKMGKEEKPEIRKVNT